MLSVRHLSQSSKTGQAQSILIFTKQTEIFSTENKGGGTTADAAAAAKAIPLTIPTQVAPAREKASAGIKTLSSSTPWSVLQPKLYSCSLQTDSRLHIRKTIFQWYLENRDFFHQNSQILPERKRRWQKRAGIYPDNHEVVTLRVRSLKKPTQIINFPCQHPKVVLA